MAVVEKPENTQSPHGRKPPVSKWIAFDRSTVRKAQHNNPLAPGCLRKYAANVPQVSFMPRENRGLAWVEVHLALQWQADLAAFNVNCKSNSMPGEDSPEARRHTFKFPTPNIARQDVQQRTHKQDKDKNKSTQEIHIARPTHVFVRSEE